MRHIYQDALFLLHGGFGKGCTRCVAVRPVLGGFFAMHYTSPKSDW